MNNIIAEKKHNRSVGGFWVASGVIEGIAAGVLFGVAEKNRKKAEEEEEEGNWVIYDPSPEQYALSGVSALMALISISYGVHKMHKDVSPQQLQNYYHRKYPVSDRNAVDVSLGINPAHPSISLSVRF